MSRSRHTEAQMMAALKQVEAGEKWKMRPVLMENPSVPLDRPD